MYFIILFVAVSTSMDIAVAIKPTSDGLQGIQPVTENQPSDQSRQISPMICPQGFKQISTTCPSSDGMSKWSLLHHGILQFQYRMDADNAEECPNLNSTVRELLLLISNKSAGEDASIHYLDQDNVTGWWFPLVIETNMSLLQDKIEDVLEGSVITSRNRSNRCMNFADFEIISPLEVNHNDSIQTPLSQRDCHEEWFSGPSDDFTPVRRNGSLLIFFNGTYISPHWFSDRTYYSLNESLHISNWAKISKIGVCGTKVDVLNCAIVLLEDQYSLEAKGNSTTVIYNGTEYGTDKFGYLSNNSIRICIVYENTGENITEDPIHKTDTYTIYATVLNAISTLCLFLLLITYSVFSELRNFQGCVIISFVVSLSISQVYWFIDIYDADLHDSTRVPSEVCQGLAMITHFTYLSVFSWMNVLALDLCLSFKGTVTRVRHAQSTLKKYARYSLFGWGAPLIIILISIGLHFTENDVIPFKYGGNSLTCWLYPNLALNVFFVGPVFVSVVINMVFLAITVVNIWRTTRVTRQTLGQAERKAVMTDLIIYFKLSLLMGVSWVLGPLAGWVGTSEVLWYIFATVTNLQGVFLFFSFGFNARLRKMWMEKWRSSSFCRRCRGSETSSDSSSAYTEVTQKTSVVSV